MPGAGGAQGAGAGGAVAFSLFQQSWGAPGSGKGRKPPGLSRGSVGSAALPGLLPAAPAGTVLREPLVPGSGVNLALLLQPQASLIPYVILGFFSKALTSFSGSRWLSWVCHVRFPRMESFGDLRFSLLRVSHHLREPSLFVALLYGGVSDGSCVPKPSSALIITCD